MKIHRITAALVPAMARLITCRHPPMGSRLAAMVAPRRTINANQASKRGLTFMSPAQIENWEEKYPDDVDEVPVEADVLDRDGARPVIATQLPRATPEHRD